MAQRKWIAKWGTVYAGTDHEEEVDLCDDLGIGEEEAEEMTEEKANELVSDYAYEYAKELIEAWAKPADE
jgi:hypothetical protein